MSDTKPSAHEWSIAFCHRQYGRIYMDAWSTEFTLMDQGVPQSGCASLLTWRDRLLVDRQTRPGTAAPRGTTREGPCAG